MQLYQPFAVQSRGLFNNLWNMGCRHIADGGLSRVIVRQPSLWKLASKTLLVIDYVGEKV